MYSEVNNTARKTVCAMVTAMDNATRMVILAYKQAGLWDDTVLVFSTDNGGPLPDHTNYPLRSGKAHNWEGGVRGIGFVRGTNSALAKVPAGQTQELMHTTDWLPVRTAPLAPSHAAQISKSATETRAWASPPAGNSPRLNSH